jgi:ABC-type taurine transport system substrate-binding protein
MVSSGTLRRVALVRSNVSEELSASFVRVTRIGELGTTLAVTSIVPISPILVTLMKDALSSSETLVLTRTKWRNIPEDIILQKYQESSWVQWATDE